MKSFRDSQSREWTVEVNVSALKRVKDSAGLDLTRLVDPDSDVIRQLSDDVFLLYEVLCALIRPQIEQQGLSAEEFGAALDEESTEKAATALFEAIIDFFREDKRTLLKRAFTKVKTAAERTQTEAVERALKEVESEQFDQAISRAMSGDSSTSSPDSSVSIPVPSP